MVGIPNFTLNLNFGKVVPLNPLTLPGLQGYWTTTAGVNRSGSNVSQWTDQSSNGYVLNCTNNPQFNASSFNSAFPGITVAGNNQFTCSVAAGFTACSIFVLYQLGTAVVNSTCSLVGNGGASFATTSLTLFNFDQGGGQNAIDFSDGTAVTTYATPNYNTPSLIGGQWNGSIKQMAQNGILLPSKAADAAGPIGDAGVDNTFFWATDSFVSDFLSAGTFAFMGFTNTFLSSAQWAGLAAWCNANWGTSF